MSKSKGEMREVPFLKNDMQDQPATTGRPVNTSDAPGKADSELTEDQDSNALDPDDKSPP
jgi:hypothetical protein